MEKKRSKRERKEWNNYEHSVNFFYLNRQVTQGYEKSVKESYGNKKK